MHRTLNLDSVVRRTANIAAAIATLCRSQETVKKFPQVFSQIRADLATCGVDEPAFGLMVYIDLRARAIFDSGQDLLQAFELREQQALGALHWERIADLMKDNQLEKEQLR